MTVTLNRTTFALNGLFLTALIAVGCASEPMRVHLTTYDETGAAQEHYADFTRAYYTTGPNGLMAWALSTEQPSPDDPTQIVTQIVHIREIWKTRPGKTFANASQINAQVRYAILTPPTGVRYDGSAFITYKSKRFSDVQICEIEAGRLTPSKRMGDVTVPFGPARFNGTFEATENQATVAEAAQLIDALFSTPAATDAAPGK